jgi:GNAT superfamily N-acetyltransferase
VKRDASTRRGGDLRDPAAHLAGPDDEYVLEVHGGEPTLRFVQVRRATARDAPSITRIQERGWQAAYRHVFPVEELDRGGFIQPSRWRERIRRPPAGWITFVAARDHIVVGFAALGPSRDLSELGELYAIYVDPDEWSSGAGRALIDRAEQALAASYLEATLWVLEENERARRFYELAGWLPDGARKADERWGVSAPEVRYRKRLTSSRS